MRLGGPTALVLAVYAAWYVKRVRAFRSRIDASIPGPKVTNFIFNHLALLYKHNGLQPEFVSQLLSWYGSESSVFRLWVGPTKPLFFVHTAEAVKSLLDSADERDFDLHFAVLRFLRKENLMFQNDPSIYKPLRNAYFGLSSPERLDIAHDVSLARVDAVCANWANTAMLERSMTNSFEILGDLVYDSVARVVFGANCWDFEETWKVKHCHEHCMRVCADFRSPLSHSSQAFKSYEAKTEELHRAVAALIDRRLDAMRSDLNYGANNDMLGFVCTVTVEGKPLFKDVLSTHKKSATSALVGFLNGAVETTHSVLYWFLVNMSVHKNKQAKLLSEIDSKLGRRLAPKRRDVSGMKYLQACVAESMRMCPSVLKTARNLNRPTVVPGCDASLPGNSMVVVLLDTVFKDESVFGNEIERFLPERFLTGDEKTDSERYAAMDLAFGGGPRSCVGMKLAKTDIYAIVSRIFQKFSVGLADSCEEEELWKTKYPSAVRVPTTSAPFVFEKR